MSRTVSQGLDSITETNSQIIMSYTLINKLDPESPDPESSSGDSGMGDIGKTGIVPFMYFYYIQNPVASTDIRVEPVIQCNADFEKFIHGKKYDNLIFQQTFWKDMAMLFDGPKIVDLCDPDWLKYAVDVVELGQYIDAFTCSSATLRDLVQSYFPEKIVEHVPDRFDFSQFPAPKVLHHGKAKKAVWFGYTHNAHELLPQLAPAIKEFDLELLIVANAPYSQDDEVSALNPGFIKYEHYSSREYIAKADIVLNPRSNRAYFRYKSNNKSVIAWKLGVPVAVTCDDIARLMNPDERNSEVSIMQPSVEKEYDIEKSVKQYRSIIDKIENRY